MKIKNKKSVKKNEMPNNFPFWARLKIGKKRTTLVIDEDNAWDKKKKKIVARYVDREATHTFKKEYEKVSPNPDKDDEKSMYLKRPQKRPKDLYMPHNKKLDMPENLKLRYEKNNKKKNCSSDLSSMPNSGVQSNSHGTITKKRPIVKGKKRDVRK